MNEKEFHKSRVAFLILNGEIHYLRNNEMSHTEWYDTLDSNEDFSEITRGYVLNNNIVYYFGDFEYDGRTIEVAKKTHQKIAADNGLCEYSVYCGVTKGSVGDVWPPKFKVADISNQ